MMHRKTETHVGLAARPTPSGLAGRGRIGCESSTSNANALLCERVSQRFRIIFIP
jgi:hypothetical protein